MPIRRVNYQEGITLLEFYKKESGLGDELFRKKTEHMTNAVHLLNQIFKETIVYGETSHLRIGLIPNETGNQPKVRIANIGLKDYYYVGFEMPEEIAPWEHAWVEGKQVSFKELERYILIAMKKSEAWDETPELNKLYAKNKID